MLNQEIFTDKNNSKFWPGVSFLSYRIFKTNMPIIKAVREIFNRKIVTIIILDIRFARSCEPS